MDGRNNRPEKGQKNFWKSFALFSVALVLAIFTVIVINL